MKTTFVLFVMAFNHGSLDIPTMSIEGFKTLSSCEKAADDLAISLDTYRSKFKCVMVKK